MAVCILFLLASILSSGLSVRDLTQVAFSSGEDVVDAVIATVDAQFGSSSRFWTEGDNSVFFKDLALVESDYGTDEDTFRTQHLGGIWQVMLPAFEDTQDPILLVRNIEYKAKVEEIEDAFGIMWEDVTWTDLAKPLHSLLAARLALHVKAIETTIRGDICLSIPTMDERDLYGEYWFKCYREETSGDPADFEEAINPEVCSFPSDVVFVLDSSGSINFADENNWDRVRYFTGNFTKGLLSNTGTRQQNLNRVGIITFSYFTTIHSNLTSNRDEILQIIEDLPYDGHTTNTAEGLCRLLEMNWGEDRLRLVIVMTDGMSNSDSPRCGTTINAPKLVNSVLCPSPLYYVIGVTNNVEQTELEAIATGPEFIDHLDSFENTAGLADFRRQRTYQICFKASALICDQVLDKNSVQRDDRERYQVDVGDGVTIRLCVNSGSVVLYASVENIPTPSRALNTFSFENGLLTGAECEDLFVDPDTITAMRSIPMVPMRGKRQATEQIANFTIYITIEGVAENSSFTLETPPGNSSMYSTSCNDNICGANTVCTDELIGYSCDCLTGYEFESNLLDCVEVNECVRQPAPCDLSAYCTNTVRNYECTCHSGYTGDGRSCVLDEGTEWRLIITVVCSIGGALIALLVILAALINIYKVTTAKKNCQRDVHNPRGTELAHPHEKTDQEFLIPAESTSALDNTEQAESSSVERLAEGEAKVPPAYEDIVLANKQAKEE